MVAIIIMLMATMAVVAFKLGVEWGRLDADEAAYEEGIRDILDVIPDKEWSRAMQEVLNE